MRRFTESFGLVILNVFFFTLLLFPLNAQASADSKNLIVKATERFSIPYGNESRTTALWFDKNNDLAFYGACGVPGTYWLCGLYAADNSKLILQSENFLDTRFCPIYQLTDDIFLGTSGKSEHVFYYKKGDASATLIGKKRHDIILQDIVDLNDDGRDEIIVIDESAKNIQAYSIEQAGLVLLASSETETSSDYRGLHRISRNEISVIENENRSTGVYFKVWDFFSKNKFSEENIEKILFGTKKNRWGVKYDKDDQFLYFEKSEPVNVGHSYNLLTKIKTPSGGNIQVCGINYDKQSWGHVKGGYPKVSAEGNIVKTIKQHYRGWVYKIGYGSIRTEQISRHDSIKELKLKLAPIERKHIKKIENCWQVSSNTKFCEIGRGSLEGIEYIKTRKAGHLILAYEEDIIFGAFQFHGIDYTYILPTRKNDRYSRKTREPPLTPFILFKGNVFKGENISFLKAIPIKSILENEKIDDLRFSIIGNMFVTHTRGKTTFYDLDIYYDKNAVAVESW
ncbi:MAG: hypothetical protein HQL71_15690 [Magnetococcales bacterium]|nr:hypothetical protein [Magnetococcales bacterium]